MVPPSLSHGPNPQSNLYGPRQAICVPVFVPLPKHEPCETRPILGRQVQYLLAIQRLRDRGCGDGAMLRC